MYIYTYTYIYIYIYIYTSVFISIRMLFFHLSSYTQVLKRFMSRRIHKYLYKNYMHISKKFKYVPVYQKGSAGVGVSVTVCVAAHACT